MKKILSIIFFISVSIYSYGQVEGQESIEIGNNVNVFKDPRLNILEKRPALMAKAELETKALKMARDAVKENLPANTTKIPEAIKQGKKLISGTIVTKSGFRIVIYNGTDRMAAMQAKNNFMRTFSSMRSYMTYNVPSYKIKVGDFETKKEAQNYMRRVITLFPSSFIAPDLVTVKNINIIRE